MNFLKKYADQLIENGYNIIPVQTGKKRPLFDEWTSSKFQSYDEMEAQLGKTHIKTHQGIGVLCNKDVIGLDIDVYNEDLTDELVSWLKDRYGNSLLFRYGNRPKVLLPFQYTGKMIGKRHSPKYEENGKKHQIEVLRGGAQFVAFNTLENGGEYTWEKDTHTGMQNLSILDIPVSKLPIIDDDTITDFISYFNDLCEERGLTKTTRSIIHDDYDTDVLTDVSKVSLTHAQIKEVLRDIDRYSPTYKDHYDNWREVGMALWHQNDGDSLGYETWIDWSATSPAFNRDEYEKGVYKKQWKSFDPAKGNHNPITFRTIIFKLEELKYDAADQSYRELKDLFLTATTLRDIDKASHRVVKTDMPAKYRTMLVNQAIAAYKRIGEIPPTAAKLSKDFAFDYSNSNIPHWCENWVYASNYETFVHTRSKKEKSPFSFNAAYTRYLQEQGGTAVEAALNVFKIKNIDATMYAPSYPLFFEHENRKYLNTYRDDILPEEPETLTKRQKWGVEVFKRHILEHLIADKRDAELFMSWLAHQVQKTGEKVGWACVLQGTQGDGKSSIAYIMRHVLGTSNLRIIGNKTIQGNFANWVSGYSLGVIEELNINNKNGHAIINDLKQYITNPIVEMEKKGRDAESVLHFSNYLFLTNEEFPLRVDDNDRRFFMIKSRFQDMKTLKQFVEENPSYYEDLAFVVQNPVEFAGAIRKYLSEYPLSEEFLSSKHAPFNEAKLRLIQGFNDKVFEDLAHQLETSTRLGSNSELFSLTKFIAENLDEHEMRKYLPRWKHVFSTLGMQPISGRAKLGEAGSKKVLHSFYAIDPKKWTQDGTLDGYIDLKKVRNALPESFYDYLHDEDETKDDYFDDDVFNPFDV